MNMPKIFFLATFSIILLAPQCWAQTKTAHPATSADPDRLGQTCAQILKMSSSEWVPYFAEKTAQAPADKSSASLRAIASYGKCYDDRTSHLAASLAKSGKGPLMGANGTFRDFQKALDDFMAKALAATHKDPGTQPAAFATLYEKQFRYQFYQSYAQKDFLSRPLTPEESDELAKAKNHFGEVLGLLPDNTLHPVHAAFRQIFDAAPVSDLTKLELYRFAIFLLAPAKDKPFSPPPF
jgi:hypothetical protein